MSRFSFVASLALTLLCAITSHAHAQDKELLKQSGKAISILSYSGHPWFVLIDADGNLKLQKSKQVEFVSESGTYSLLDVISVDDNKWLAAVLDENSHNIDLFELSIGEHSITQRSTIKVGNADIEALCLAHDESGVQLVTVDALGIALQRYVAFEQASQFVDVPIRQFAVGPNIKDCSSDVTLDALYFAEETAGVWRYPLAVESELSRTLITLGKDASVESVFALQDGEIVAVSSNHPGVWIGTDEQIHFTSLDDNKNAEYESVSALHHDGSLLLGLVDDSTGTISVNAIHYVPYTTSEQLKSSANKTVKAYAETTPVARHGDAADDPAIWRNSEDLANSRILGTDKKSSLNVYALNGELLQRLPVGRVNNVDVRQDVVVGTSSLDLAAASNRTTKQVSLFTIDEQGTLAIAGHIDTDLDDIYGLCMYQHAKGADVIVNDTSGEFRRYRLISDESKLSGQLLERFNLPSQPEGCVADDNNGLLYYGEESRGIWLRDLNQLNTTAKRIIDINEGVEPDIEGMGLYQLDGNKYLVVSSQGNDRFAIYNAETPFNLLGTFAVGANLSAGIDGVSETDGLAITSLPLGEGLEQGLLVVQDGHNVMPLEAQNFKLISGSAIATLIRQWR